MRESASLFLAFFIFLASLIPKLDIEEFAKIPKLINHFYEHSKENSKLDFIAFLTEHYQTKEKTNPEHKDLPFINHQCSNFVFILSEIKIQLPEVYHIFHITFNFSIVHFLSITGKSLFQPPKF